MPPNEASVRGLKLLVESFLLEHSLFRTYEWQIGDLCEFSYVREPHTSGTTATETANARGRYSEPVYFDWHAEWPRVRRLFEEAETQRILNVAIVHARALGWEVCLSYASDDMNVDEVIKPYDVELKWPYFHLGQDRASDGEQDKMVCELLPDPRSAEVDEMVAAELTGGAWINCRVCD